MTMTQYAKGTAFERRIRDALHKAGYAVSRGAGSKGTSKADLVGFSPHGAILIIQAKTNGIISIAEWTRLYEVAGWSGHAIPIIAYKDGRKLVMDEITGPRVRMKPRENRRPYDWRCACQPPHEDLSKIDN